MRVVAVIQARMSSTRLPGKVMRDLCGRPMIDYLLNTVSRCQGIAEVVLATSDDESDDPLAAFVSGAGGYVMRGDLNDVAGRVLDAGQRHAADAIVRLSGDSPIMCRCVVDAAVERFQFDQPDLASNVVIRTFPKGQSVEVIEADALALACESFENPEDREHVTPYFYRHADRFRISSLTFGRDESNRQLSVDTIEDFERAKRILESMTRPHWDYSLDELIAIADHLERDPK